MKKILIFGNSGSGKSTLARSLCAAHGLVHLDLDTLAWQATSPPLRRPLGQSREDIMRFIQANQGWVIEGCYSDLLEMAVPGANEMVFLNLPLEACIANAKSRPWEPHKYASKAAQDANLGMLLDWIAQYSVRTDTFSESRHSELYANYSGKKRMVTCNEIVGQI